MLRIIYVLRTGMKALCDWAPLPHLYPIFPLSSSLGTLAIPLTCLAGYCFAQTTFLPDLCLAGSVNEILISFLFDSPNRM